jgi:Xaa-Pro aminopeptidase
MIYRQSRNHLFTKQLANFCTLVTYSAVTAVCLQRIQFSTSFSPVATRYSYSTAGPSLSASLSTSTSFNQYYSHQSSTNTYTDTAFLHIRGGASSTSKRSIFNMVSSSTETSESTSTPASASEKIITNDPKLTALRKLMKEQDIDAYIVPSDDPHLSEYVPTAYMRRKFLSGFGGSAGTAVVTQDEALLWTDSRYHNEATLQLDANHWTLMKQGLPKVPTLTKYIADLAGEQYTTSKKTFNVGIDPFVHPASFEKELNDAFDTKAEDVLDIDNDEDEDAIIGELKTLDNGQNFVDDVWGEERPPIPTSPFKVHPIEYAGESITDKVTKIREAMKEKKATMVVFTALDDIAYLMNLRAKGDVDTCPVGISYATISVDGISLFCDSKKVQSKDVQDHLEEANVVVCPYDDILEHVQSHLENTKSAKVWIDKTRSNYALSRIIPEKSLVNKQNPITPMKGCKNEAEMEGMRRAHIVDGVAMAHAISSIENTIVNEGKSLSEVQVDEIITGERAKQPGFQEVSFPTIAGVGSNGAIIHYSASVDSELLQHLTDKEPILIDSGGQYTYGTTDVTRTWHFGEGTQEFKENYTRVLKGNIGVDTMIFPENTPGFVLDVFARKALWEGGKDYGHGTGHGVGAALNVHEGPHSISPRFTNLEALKKGMVVSNEPGFYEDGVSGIRIENLLEITYIEDGNNDAYNRGIKQGDEGYPELAPGQKRFLCMKKLTMIPIQKNLIVVSMMTKDELDWLDAYHEEVFQKVAPLMDEDSAGFRWLTKACEKINRN